MPWHCTICNTPLQNGDDAIELHTQSNPGCRGAVFSDSPMSSPVTNLYSTRSGAHVVIQMPERPDTSVQRQQADGDSRAIDIYFALNQIGVFFRNMGFPLGKNIVSVGIPTVVREAMRRGPLAMLSKSAPMVSFGLGVSACAVPIITEIIGLVRDNRNNNQTLIAVISRVLLIMAVGSTCITAIALGAFANAAPALIAANVFYTPLRDVSQYFIQLKGGDDNGTSQKATALSAASYFVNQLAINFGMDAVVKALQPALSEIVSNIIGRSILNVAGETLDDMVSRYFNAILTSKAAPKLSLGVRSKQEMNVTSLYDQTFNVNSSRSSLFASIYNVSYSIKNDAWSNVGAAGVVALAYIPFINVASQTTNVDASTLESGQSTQGVLTTPHSPSVHFINETLKNTISRRQSGSVCSIYSQNRPPQVSTLGPDIITRF